MFDPTNGFSGRGPASSSPSWSPDVLGSVSRHVSVGRYRAASAATQKLVLTYRRVRHEILERRQTYEGHRTQVVNRLFADVEGEAELSTSRDEDIE